MFLTAPQSSHYRSSRFEASSPRENHFDWDLYYRFRHERERFWRSHVESDPEFRERVQGHFAAFQQSIARTVRLLEGIDRPVVLDVGLSSEQLDRAMLTRTGGDVVILDVHPDAGEAYARAFGGRGAFILGDVISLAREGHHANRFDLVYSVGLIEHFPDKSDILDAHIRLTKPGGIVLVYAPIDTPVNRRLTSLATEWENFGHRELLTPEELAAICRHASLEPIAVEPVGFFSAVWARKSAADA
jgi:SAM-dependent methyltransferase